MDNHTGGKLTGQGSFGCVYKPSLKCRGQTERLDGYVSKIMEMPKAALELREHRAVDKIDPKFYFHLKMKNPCYPAPPDQETDLMLSECRLNNLDVDKLSDPNDKNYAILNVEDGGVGLDKYLRNKDTVLKDAKKCEMMLYDFTRIVYGVDQFFKNKSGHFDLKSNNIVIKEDSDRFRFNLIDFGLSGTFKKHASRNEWGRTYWLYPPERFAVYPDEYSENFYNSIKVLSESNLSLSEIKSNTKMMDEFTNIVLLLKKFGEIRESRQRPTLVLRGIYGKYGIEATGKMSDERIFDYVEWHRLLGPMSAEDKKKMFIRGLIEQLDVFCLGLAMIDMLYAMTKEFYPSVVLNIGGDETLNQEYYQKIKTSGITGLKAFYTIIYKACVPTFPRRASASEILQDYVKGVYEPIKEKYQLEDFEFLNPVTARRQSVTFDLPNEQEDQPVRPARPRSKNITRPARSRTQERPTTRQTTRRKKKNQHRRRNDNLSEPIPSDPSVPAFRQQSLPSDIIDLNQPVTEVPIGNQRLI